MYGSPAPATSRASWPQHAAPCPHLGHTVQVRHVLGADAGGGYEWTAAGAVSHGINVLRLDEQGLITSFESMWDGSQADHETLLAIAKAAIER